MPSWWSPKQERAYKNILKGYSDNPRGKEIAARTVNKMISEGKLGSNLHLPQEENMAYTGPAIKSHGSHIHQVNCQPVMGADVGKAQMMLKTIPQALGAKLTKFRTYEKDGKLCAVAIVENPAGLKMILVTCLPLPDWTALEGEVGWGLPSWSDIKDFGKDIGKTVAKGAKAAGAGMLKVVSSPEFQEIATQAAPIALGALGVPPPLTQKALEVVNRAKGGSAAATEKVANINSLAQQGYPPAQQLYGIMASYFRGGLPAVMNLPPMVPPGLGLPIPGSYRPPYMPPQYQPQYQPQFQPQSWYGPQWQQWGQYQQQLAQGQPFNIPTPGFGQGYISGWVWNVPYRSPVSALSLDMTNPFNLVRSMYHKGASK